MKPIDRILGEVNINVWIADIPFRLDMMLAGEQWLIVQGLVQETDQDRSNGKRTIAQQLKHGLKYSENAPVFVFEERLEGSIFNEKLTINPR